MGLRWVKSGDCYTWWMEDKPTTVKSLVYAGFSHCSFFLPYLFLDEKVAKNQALYFLFKAAGTLQNPKLHDHRIPVYLSGIMRVGEHGVLYGFCSIPASQENKAQRSI